MKLITLRQPWPAAIFALGADVINRRWRTHYRGRLYIHSACEGVSVEDMRTLAQLRGISESDARALFRSLPETARLTGHVLGHVELRDITTAHAPPWRAHHITYGWIVAEPTPLSEPIACRGRMRLWTATHTP